MARIELVAVELEVLTALENHEQLTWKELLRLAPGLRSGGSRTKVAQMAERLLVSDLTAAEIPTYAITDIGRRVLHAHLRRSPTQASL
jgi:hypothetical protein